MNNEINVAGIWEVLSSSWFPLVPAGKYQNITTTSLDSSLPHPLQFDAIQSEVWATGSVEKWSTAEVAAEWNK
jgi:hypothetical protein